MQMKYDIKNYDENLCLRISPIMWIAILFLLRDYVIGLLSVVNFKDQLALINLFYSNPAQLFLGVLAGLPVLVVLYAWRERKPDASVRTKWIWRNGRGLLVTSAVLNIVAVVLSIFIGMSHHLDYAAQAHVAVCGAVLGFLLTSKRVSETFSDFPKSVGNRAVS
jgi:hypothetical protein